MEERKIFNFTLLLKNKSKLFPDKVALISGEKKITFGQLHQLGLKCAAGLWELTPCQPARIGIFLPNSWEYIVAYTAIFSLHFCAVPLDFMLSEEELISILKHAQVDILIARRRININYGRLERDTGVKIVLVNEIQETRRGDFLSFSQLIKNGAEEKARAFIDNAWGEEAIISYTSGTTGQPKAVVITYDNLEYSPRQVKYFLPDINENDNILCAIPLSHAGGWVYFLLMVYFGLQVVLMERFAPRQFLKNIEQFKITFFWIVPSMYVALFTLKDLEGFNLKTLRYVVVFGAPSSPRLLKKFHKLCPQAKLLNGWGMTETSPPNIVTPPDSANIESIGVSSPDVEVKLVNEEGEEVKEGEVGELLIRGKAVFKGYYKNPSLNEASFTPEGFFRTGDLAYRDEKGFYYIAGRKKQMLKVGGEIVFLWEIEKALSEHPAVQECAAVGVSDRLRGEVPKVFIVSKEDTEVKEEELREFLKKKLAHFKIPHYFEFVKELPKTRSGKIAEGRLKHMAENRIKN